MQSRSSFRNGLKRRSKRDVDEFESNDWNEPCNDGDSDQCEAHPNTTAASFAIYIQHWGTNEERGQSGYSYNKDSFGKKGMCRTNKCLFNFHGFAAIMNGYISLLQAGAGKMFPVESFTLDDLLAAEYVKPFGDTYVLMELGLSALSLDHISSSQLSELGLYPLQPGTISLEALLEAGYINKDCFPTALGIAATKTRYIRNKDFSEFGCRPIDHSEISASHLQNAKYIIGAYLIVTPIGLSALNGGHLKLATLQRVGAFGHQSSLDNERDSMFNIHFKDIIRELIGAGYVHRKSLLVTNFGYLAVVQKAVKVEHLRRLNLWPSPTEITLDALISAHYVSSCGHLTKLGYSLLHARYYSIHWLTRLGVQISNSRHIFSHAIVYSHFSKPSSRRDEQAGFQDDESETVSCSSVK